MDEVSIFTALRPAPPADAEKTRQRARLRLDAAITAAGSPGSARALRKRRRPVVLSAAAVAAAACAAIVVPAVLPGSTGSFATPAWAVQRSSDGTITITIRKTLSDQAGLQRALRADGVPAYVRSMSGCQYWEPQGGIKQIRQDWKALIFPAPGNNDRDFGAVIIHPAALPKGEAVFIGGGALGHGGLALQLFVMRNDRPPVCVPRHGLSSISNSHSAHSHG
jgi:hypothetical protein